VKALARRICVLEKIIRPNKAGNNLDLEIQEMTAAERNNLREFLLRVKNGGQLEDANYENMKHAAEEALIAARQRLSEASKKSIS